MIGWAVPDTGARSGRRPRRVVVGLTLVLGVAMLTATLHLEPGNDTFVLGALAMATIWAVGARACGPLPWRATGQQPHRPAARTAHRAVRSQLLLGAVVGGGALTLCLIVGTWASGIPALAQPAQELLAHRSTLPFATVVAITALNGVAEEMYFRGALYDALPARSAWLWSAAAYALATLPSGVALLTAGAALLGVLTGLVRRRTGGLLAPVCAHLVWSIGMLLLLPSVLS